MSRARDLADFASDSQINAGEIEDNAVTTAKIADSNVTNAKLANSTIIVSGDSGSDSVALGETLTISGTANEIETTGTSNTLTVGLPDDVTIGNDLTVTEKLKINTTTQLGRLTISGSNDYDDGPVLWLHGDSVNQQNSGTIRLTEDNASMQGAWISYNGAGNRLLLGTHSAGDFTTSNDVTHISMLRGSGFVGINIGDANPAYPLVVGNNEGIQDAAIEIKGIFPYLRYNDTGDSTYVTQQLNASTFTHTQTGNIQYRITENTSTRFYYNAIVDGDLTVDTDTLHVDSTNNRVGIGTSSPGYPLHVVGSADGSQLEALTLTNSAGTDGSEIAIRFINSTDIDNGPNATEISSIRNGTNDHDLVFSTSNGSVTERLRITSEGYVGIGTTSPATALDIRSDGTSTDIVTFRSDLGTNDRSMVIRSPSSDSTTEPFVFQTGNSFAFVTDTDTVLTIADSRNVGIGTASPQQKLHVSSGATNLTARFQSSDAGAVIAFTDTGGSSWIGTNGSGEFAVATGGSANISANDATQNFTIDSSGNVGIGTTTPSYKLEVTGDAYVSTNLTVGGNLTVSGTTTTIDTTNTQVTDNLLELNSGATANTNDAGIIIERGSTGDNAIMMWDESADTFRFGTTTATASDTGNLTITESPVITGKLTVHTSDDTIFYSIPGSDYTNDQANAYFGFTSDGTSPGTTNYGYWSQFKITAGGSAGRSNLQIGMRRADGDADYPDLVVTHEGRVGIGTSSPLHPLQVQGVIYPTTYLQLNSGQQVKFGNGNQYIEGTNDTSLELATGGSTSMIINNSGQVGIGTTSPNNNNLIHARLASASLPSTSNQSVGLFENSVNSWITVGAGATSYAGILFADSGDADVGQLRYNHNDDSMQLVVNADVKVHIDSSGQVGIGTTSPSSPLEVQSVTNPVIKVISNGYGSSAGVTIDGGSSYDSSLYFLDSGTTKYNLFKDGSQSDDFRMLSYTDTAGATDFLRYSINGSLRFSTAAAERMRIDSSGNVGIGTSSPDGTLHVFTASSGTVTANGNADDLVIENNGTTGLSILSSSGQNGNIYFGTPDDNKSAEVVWVDGSDQLLIGTSSAGGNIKFRTGAQSDAVVIDSSGKLGIGTTSPQRTLHVVGPDGTAGVSEGNSNCTLYVDNNDSCIINIQSGTGSTDYGAIFFSDAEAQNRGAIYYYHPTNDILFNTNGAERMRIDSSGRVLVGKSSGTYPLDVDSGDYVGNILRGTRGTASFTIYQATDSHSYLGTTNAADLIINTNNTERMRIHSEGYTELKSSDSYNQLVLTPSGTNAPASINFNTPGTGRAKIKVQDQEYISILSTGNVGIQAIPSAWDGVYVNLQIGDTGINYAKNDGNELYGIGSNFYYDGTSNKRIIAGYASRQYFTSGGVFWNTASTSTAGSSITFDERMRLTNTGYLGIGTSSPNRQLTVSGSANIVNSNAGLYIGTSTSGGFGGNHAIARAALANYHITGSGEGDFCIGAAWQKDILLGTSTATSGSLYARLVITQSGNVGIGITNPGVALDVSGAIRATGDITAFYSSDITLKTNVENIQNPIDKVKQLNGVSYNWTEEAQKKYNHFTDNKEIGVIAQDVEKVLPEIVAERDDGTKAVRYERMCALLIECVKDLQNQIDDLKKGN